MTEGIISLGSGSSGPESKPVVDVEEAAKHPKVQKILANTALSNREKRNRILSILGLRKKKKKYKTKEDREAAAKRRIEKRRGERLSLFGGLGIAPQPKLKLAPEEKKERGKARRQRRATSQKSFINQMIEEHPEKAQELADKLGINIKKFKI